MKLRVWIAIAAAMGLLASPAIAALRKSPIHIVVGQVVRHDGGPRNNLTIHLDDMTTSPNSERLTTTTDLKGRWEITALSGAPHLLWVDRTCPGGDQNWASCQPVQYYPSAADAAGATPLDVSGALTQVRFTLRTGILHGRLIRAGAPVDGMVFMKPVGYTATSGFLGSTSGNHGTFSVIAVPGPYDLVVQKLGSELRSYLRVIVTEGKGTNLPDLIIPIGSKVTGRVTDSAGNPYPNVVVELDPTSENLDNLPGVAVTDANGFYQVTDLQPGPYTGKVAPIDGVHAPTPLNGGVTFAIPDGQTTTMPDAVVAVGATVTFTVTDFRGKPAAGVRIFELGDNVPLGITDALGQATVGGYSAGTHIALLRPDRDTTDALTTTTSPFTVALGQSLSVSERLPASDWVSGRITDSTTHSPVSGIEVDAQSPCPYWATVCGDASFAKTDANGYYVIHGLTAYASASVSYTISDHSLVHPPLSHGNYTITTAPGRGHTGLDFQTFLLSYPIV